MKVIYKKIKLPKKLSDAIEMAVQDLILVERDKKYNVDMKEWHTPERTGKCAVCFAGSVIAKSFDASPEKHIFYDSYGAKSSNSFRTT